MVVTKGSAVASRTGLDARFRLCIVRGAGKPLVTSGPPSRPCVLNVTAAANKTDKTEKPRTILWGRLQAHQRAVVLIGRDI